MSDLEKYEAARRQVRHWQERDQRSQEEIGRLVREVERLKAENARLEAELEFRPFRDRAVSKAPETADLDHRDRLGLPPGDRRTRGRSGGASG